MTSRRQIVLNAFLRYFPLHRKCLLFDGKLWQQRYAFFIQHIIIRYKTSSSYSLFFLMNYFNFYKLPRKLDEEK